MKKSYVKPCSISCIVAAEQAMLAGSDKGLRITNENFERADPIVLGLLRLEVVLRKTHSIMMKSKIKPLKKGKTNEFQEDLRSYPWCHCRRLDIMFKRFE